MPEPNKKTVLVVGPQFLYKSYTHPANARKLLHDGLAKVISKTPFTIQIVGGANPKEGSNMIKQRKPITNFTDYFKEEKDVYVQNIGSTQISLEFKDASDNVIAVLIPKNRKPLNLTQHVAFSILKNSTDLRKMVNRRPPLLNLLNEDEFLGYYESLAQRNKTSVDDEIESALEEQSGLMNKTKYEAPPEEKPKKIEELRKEAEANMTEDEMVTPAIVGMCNKADKDAPNRLKAGDFIEELSYMDDKLTSADLEYISLHGAYSTVKKWAANEAARRSGEEVEEVEAIDEE